MAVILAAVLHQAVNVITIPAFPVSIVGLVSVVALRRTPALRDPTALQALIVAGMVAFAVTALVFPVATVWGTFLHAAGPLLCGLCVAAALGADAFVANLSERRRWGRPNVVLGPVALAALAVPLTGIGVLSVGQQSAGDAERFAAIAAEARRLLPADGSPVITDHPMWVATALGRSALALPDESLGSVAALGERLDAGWVLVTGTRGRYPAALLAAPRDACLASDPIRLDVPGDAAWLAPLAAGCGRR
jgi:hypothetical protein